MRLSLNRVSRFVLGLTFLLVVAPAFSQYEEMANVGTDSTVLTKVTAKGPGVIASLSDKELESRMNQLSSCVDVRTTAAVKSYLTHYLSRSEKTRRILSRRLTYFPLFERVLKENGIPDDLKYLAVVESALNPLAISRVGASGLWQFMPYTGTDYGMQINSAVDERNNIVKATEGAAKYLKHLYNQYNDWALVLAAYNSGPSRVNSAIRRAGSKNFWIIQRYLPKETRNYVPAFIAATYLCNFYSEHNLDFDIPELDMQIIDHITVYDGLSFSAIAKATGLEYQMVADLNPGFKRAYVPPSTRGYYVTLPKRVMPAFVRYLNGLGGTKYRLDAEAYGLPEDAPTNGAYYHTVVKPSEVEFIDRFAAKVGCSGAQLRAWNNIKSIYVQPNQALKVWNPIPVIRHIGGVDGAARKMETPVPPAKSKVEAAAAPSEPVAATPAAPAPAKPAPAKPAAPSKQYLFHKVKEKETIHDLARRYGVAVDALISLNNTMDLKPGMLVKIKELK